MTLAAPPHDVSVAADGYVVTLRCSGCGWRLECDDDEVPVAELVRIAEDHRWRAEVTADYMHHLSAGHTARLQATDGGGMAMVCSCGQAWPVEATP